MKRIYQSTFITVILSVLSFSVHAQDFEWAKFLYATDGSVSKEIKDMTKDDDGNIYVLGEYNRKSVIEEDTIEIHGNGKESCYVSKFSPEGELLWISPFGSQSYDFANNIVYADGHLFASVFLQGDKIYHKDGEFPSIGNKEGMLIKFDTNGAYVSHKQFLRGFYFNSIEKVDTMIYAAHSKEIFKLNFDLEQVGSIKFDASQYITIEDMVNVKDTAVLLAGTFGIDFIYQDTVLNPAVTGEGYKAFVTSINVEKDSMHWIHGFGKVQAGLKLAYPGGGRFYLAGNYSTDFELAGHLNPLYKFNGWHGFVVECALDGRIFKSKQMIPTEGAGSQEITALLASGNGVFVAGKVNYGHVRYDDSDTLRHKQGNRFGYVFKLDETIDYEYAVAIGPENTSFGEIFTGVVDGNKLYFGGRVHGIDTYIGCDVYNTNGQVVFQMIDRAPDETPQALFYTGGSRNGGLVRFFSSIKDADWHYWDFGDGSPNDSLALFPRHAYERKGAILAKLVAGNKCGITTTEHLIEIEGIGKMIPNKSGATNFYVGEIKGVGFTEGATFKLITENGQEKEIRDIQYTDSSTYRIMIEFLDNPEVSYDLYMENGDEKDTLKNALKIEQVEKADIHCKWSGPPDNLVGRQFAYMLMVENKGNQTAYSVPITITGPPNADMTLGTQVIRNEAMTEWINKMGGHFRYTDAGYNGHLKLGSFIIPAIPAKSKAKIRIFMSIPDDGPGRIRAFYDPPMYEPTSFFLNPEIEVALDSLICPGSPVIEDLLGLFGIDEAEAGLNISSMGCVMYSYLIELFGGVGFTGSGYGGGQPTNTFLGNIPANILNGNIVNMGPLVLESLSRTFPDKTDEELLRDYEKVGKTIPGGRTAEDYEGSSAIDDLSTIKYPEDILCVGNCDLSVWAYDICPPGEPGCGVQLVPLVPNKETPFEDASDLAAWRDRILNRKHEDFPSFWEYAYEAYWDFVTVLSKDPNEKYPINGPGEENYITKGRDLVYHITFENADTATAPASEVFVYDTLDLNVYDTTNFSWDMIGWGDFNMVIEQTGTHVVEYVDMRPYGEEIIVQFEGKIDETGVLSAVFTSLDPYTWALTDSIYHGFLPPNVIAPEGEGFFIYSIGQKPGIAHGTKIENKATIIFDRNEPITTSVALNTIDDQPPTSSIVPFESEVVYDSLVTVRFGGFDDGSGIEGYNIFIKQNSGPYAMYARNYQNDQLNIAANYGDTLSFFISATDKVGNLERKNLKTEARIAVVKQVTGLKEELNSKFTLYPNPSTGEMNIKSEMDEALYSYRIIDLTGKTIENRKLNHMSQSSIRIDQLQTGVYIMDLETSVGTVRKKIIKK